MYLLYLWCTSDFEIIVKSFSKSISIDTAYSRLFIYLFDSSIFGSVKLSSLKMALICHGNTPKSVELDKSVEEDIKAASSHECLLYTLNKHCNWLNIQLLEKMAHVCASEVPMAIKLIERYNEVVFSKNLREALPYFVSKYELGGEEEEKFVTAVCVKTHKNPALITIKEFIEWEWKAKDVILKDLLQKTPNVQHVKEGCLEVYYSVPANYNLGVYKITLYNRHQLYIADIIYVKIGKHPLIYNPWFSGFERKFTMQYQYEGEGHPCI